MRPPRSLVVAAVFVFSLSAQQPDSAARTAAESWLPLVDQGKYAESWKQASSFFRTSVTAEQWQQALQQVRGPLGRFKSRSILSSKPLRNPPNAPPGDYFLLQYTADFEHRNGTVETVIMARDGKRWLLSGYFVK